LIAISDWLDKLPSREIVRRLLGTIDLVPLVSVQTARSLHPVISLIELLNPMPMQRPE
jgi:hypothetical protein